MNIHQLVRIALFASLLFIQEQLLSLLPNVQLTQLLIVVYFYIFGLPETLMIVTLHVILDNLIMGPFSLLYTPAMWIGWILLPLILKWFSPEAKSPLKVALITSAHALIYSWLFIIPSTIIMKVNMVVYFIQDLPFEGILMANGFITVWLLLMPLLKALQRAQPNWLFSHAKQW